MDSSNNTERIAALEAEAKDQREYNALMFQTLKRIKAVVERQGASLALRGIIGGE